MTTAFSKKMVVVYLAAIFSAGAVSGWVVAKRESKPLPPPSSPPSPPGRGWTNSSIYKLKLEPDQKTKVDAIIDLYAKKMETIENVHRREIQLAMSNRNAELNAVLTEEQRQQWDKIRKDREASWRNRTNFWSGGTNGFRGGPPSRSREKGDKGDRGDRKSGERRDVTMPPPSQSPTPTAEPEQR